MYKMEINNKGFTLIELLVVIAIIGVLSTFALISLVNASARARDSERLSDVNNLAKALSFDASNNSSDKVMCGMDPCGAGVLTNLATAPVFVASEFPKFQDPNYKAGSPNPCTVTSNSRCDYSFAFDGANANANIGSTTILFWLEEDTGTLSKGLNKITTSGTFNP